MTSDPLPPPPGSSPPPPPSFGAPQPFPTPGSSTAPPPPPPGLTAPSGYVAYNNAPTPMGALRPVRKVSTWAGWLVLIAGLASVAAALLSASLSSKGQDFLDGRITEEAFLDANSRAPLGQILSSVPMIAAAVLSVIWMYRLAANGRALGRRTTFAPLLAIFGWVLPPFLFVLPLLILREIWKASSPEVAPGTEGWKASGENPMLYVWYVFYALIPAVLAVITIGSLFDTALNLDTDANSVAEVVSASSPTVLIVSGVVNLIAAGTWFVVIKQFTARHVALTGER